MHSATLLLKSLDSR